jgi:hypothetical protein
MGADTYVYRALDRAGTARVGEIVGDSKAAVARC